MILPIDLYQMIIMTLRLKSARDENVCSALETRSPLSNWAFLYSADQKIRPHETCLLYFTHTLRPLPWNIKNWVATRFNFNASASSHHLRKATKYVGVKSVSQSRTEHVGLFPLRLLSLRFLPLRPLSFQPMEWTALHPNIWVLVYA